MLIKETIIQGWQALMRNRMRSILTMLGIIWGLVCVVVLLAFGEGLGKTIAASFSNTSSGVIVLRPGQTSLQAGGQRAGRKVNFEFDDVDAIRKEVPIIRAVSAESMVDNMAFKIGTRVVAATVRGVEMPYGKMRRVMNFDDGRYFDEADFAERRRVVILGNKIARKIFQGAPAVGHSVEINGVSFDVIGVLKNKIQDSMYGGPDNDHTFIPWPTYQDLLQVRDPEIILIQPLSADLHFRSTDAARAVLGRRHHFDGKDEKAVSAWDMIEDGNMIRAFSLALEVILGFIGALTLGVGGVGVMNIMLVSVTERTREIGLRKALGARRADILRQFLLEALVLTFMGGAIGIIFSVALTWAIPPLPFYSEFYKTANHEGDIFLRASTTVMLTSFLILSVVGIMSGFWPALKASRLNPIEALRYE
jgi:putative ABC transport system permease protein